MSHGRFNNPVQAVLTGLKDLFGKQDLEDRFDDNNRIEGKTCVVTGANTGLGYAIAVQLAQRGGNVIMACRSGIPEAGERVKADSGSDKVKMMKVDLSDVPSIHAFCDALKKENMSIDILVLNAGVAPPKARKTKAGLDEMFMVNYLANFMLMHRLLQDGSLPNQKFAQNAQVGDRPRVLFISSDSHQNASAIDYEEFGTYFDYGVGKSINNYSYFKLVLNTFAVELDRRINEGNPVDVTVDVMCPG
ncbi:MAG: SDR family NAD(P)-dependent oxidoreductase, partial [Bacteroidota bacterium]